MKQKLTAYRRLLYGAGTRDNIVSLSFCLSADMINLMCRSFAMIISSVRGNLLCNYRLDYGLHGYIIAIGHLFLLRWFDHIVAMTSSMADQIRFFSGVTPSVIGNFIDEKALEIYRDSNYSDDTIRFVFLGSLTNRKRPDLLLYAAFELKRRDVKFTIDLVGDGPLRSAIEKSLIDKNIADVVRVHGSLANPYSLVAQADCMILPSTSEGVSRSVLEALYLGVPCLLRDVDGNTEVIKSGQNGLLFSADSDLVESMIKLATWSRQNIEEKKNLLPSGFRQKNNSMKYLELLES
ncbi:MAG: glycosyltransferase [Gammaproteobacteria bacterium]|nr:glycosyltransferase [Gammaproteobacteria bacterium]